MIVHIVLIRLKPGLSRNDPVLVEALGELSALRHQVAGVVRWDQGWDFVGRPVSCDYALVAAFATRADFEAYGPHPAHQAVATKLRALVDWSLCDFEACG